MLTKLNRPDPGVPETMRRMENTRGGVLRASETAQIIMTFFEERNACTVTKLMLPNGLLSRMFKGSYLAVRAHYHDKYARCAVYDYRHRQYDANHNI